MKHVMLIVKIHHQDDKGRTKRRFRKAMKEEEGWNCVQNVSNTYQYSFDEEDDVPTAVENSVRDAVQAANVSGWDAIYAVSPEEPERFKQ